VKYLDYSRMNKSKQKLVPKLRFPEFKEDGEWNYLNGNKLFKTISNKNHNSDLPILAITQDQGAIPREDIDYHVSVSKKSVESYKVVEIGDFIISLRSFQGGIEYSEYKGICSPAYIILRKKKNTVLDAFYKQYFKTNLYISHLNKNLEGIRDGKMVSYKQFSDIKIPEPNPKEQQKIAACLSSLDKLIKAHKDKLAALQRHKKGLLQNLFPQEGHNVPKHRFKEFENDGEWVEKKLGDYLLQNPEYGIGAAAVPFDNKLPTYLRITDISENRTFISENKVSVDAEVTDSQYLVEDDIVFARTGASVGKSYRYKNEDGRLVFAGFLIRVKPNIKKIKSEFIFQFLSTNQYWDWVRKVSARSGQPGINAKQYNSMPIKVPLRIQEQQKIAACLASVDNLITAQQEKLNQLAQYKKGLLQGLFPKVD